MPNMRLPEDDDIDNLVYLSDYSDADRLDWEDYEDHFEDYSGDDLMDAVELLIEADMPIPVDLAEALMVRGMIG